MKIHREWGAWVALAAIAAIGLAACSGTSAPHVASLGKSSGHDAAASTTTMPTDNPNQLLDEWATCMRGHGDPGQIDPTVDASKVIQITLGAGYNGSGLRGEDDACGSYLSAAQTALGGGPPESSSEATELKFAECMRANGIPDYPDPTGSGQVVHAASGSDLNPNSPTYQVASTLCANETGYQDKFSNGAPQPGSINVTMAGGFGGKQ